MPHCDRLETYHRQQPVESLEPIGPRELRLVLVRVGFADRDGRSIRYDKATNTTVCDFSLIFIVDCPIIRYDRDIIHF